MVKTKRDIPSSAPYHSTISHELALKRLQKLLEQIPEIRSAGHHSPMLSTWQRNVKIVLSELSGENSLVFREFDGIWFYPGFTYRGQPESEITKAFNSGLDQAKGFLESRVEDLRERVGSGGIALSASFSSSRHSDCRRVFVVHGHDHGSKETVARFLGKLDLDPVVLHEQPDQGKTIIEKFETHSEDVACAVVILTADDIASSKATPEQKELQARQNVILELGFFVGKLGRGRTFVLVEREVALPSDIHGVVYIPLDNGEWRLRLVKELKAAGLSVDANRV